MRSVNASKLLPRFTFLALKWIAAYQDGNQYKVSSFYTSFLLDIPRESPCQLTTLHYVAFVAPHHWPIWWDKFSCKLKCDSRLSRGLSFVLSSISHSAGFVGIAARQTLKERMRGLSDKTCAEPPTILIESHNWPIIEATVLLCNPKYWI